MGENRMILTSSREDFIPLLESTAAAELGHARSTMASLFDFGVCCRLAFVVHVGMMGAGGWGGGCGFAIAARRFFCSHRSKFYEAQYGESVVQPFLQASARKFSSKLARPLSFLPWRTYPCSRAWRHSGWQLRRLSRGSFPDA